MKNTKKQLLKAKGYVVGSFSEILGLSPEESEYAKFKRFLSKSLRKNRERKDLTQERFARLIKSSQSRVAKMESCDPSVSIDLLIKSHVELGVSIKELIEGFNKELRVGQGSTSMLVTASSTEPLGVRVVYAISSSAEDDLTPLH
jgi:transcriptional regulator with XRE-family HTH domain